MRLGCFATTPLCFSVHFLASNPVFLFCASQPCIHNQRYSIVRLSAPSAAPVLVVQEMPLSWIDGGRTMEADKPYANPDALLFVVSWGLGR